MRSVKEEREEDRLYFESEDGLKTVEEEYEEVESWVEESSHENISFRWNMRELYYWHCHCNPATQPAQAKLFITFSTQPWTTVIDASDVSSGVTIWDVQESIHSFLMAYTTRLEFEAQDEERRYKIGRAHV